MTSAPAETVPGSILSDLNGCHPVTASEIAFLRENGYVKLKQVLSPETIAWFGERITNQVKLLNTLDLPMEQRTTYQKAFLQIMNIWTKDETVRIFAFSKKLARIAAELMEVSGVRMYHDQALYKEPGGGVTPWHADQYYWPVSSERTITAWIPSMRSRWKWDRWRLRENRTEWHLDANWRSATRASGRSKNRSRRRRRTTMKRHSTLGKSAFISAGLFIAPGRIRPPMRAGS